MVTANIFEYFVCDKHFSESLYVCMNSARKGEREGGNTGRKERDQEEREDKMD